MDVAINGELKLGDCSFATGGDGTLKVTGLGTSGATISKLSISKLTVLGDLYIQPTTANLDIGKVTAPGNLTLGALMAASAVTAVTTTIGAIEAAGPSYYGYCIGLGGGTLILTGYNTFTGPIDLGQGFLKINSSDQLGASTASDAIRLGNANTIGNRLMLLNDSSTDFTSRGGGKVNINGSGGYIYVDRAEGGTGSNQTHTLGAVTYTSGKDRTITGGNGYGLTLGAGTVAGAFTLTNNLVSPGVLTLASLNKASTVVTFIIGGTGNTTISGAVTNALALTKSGTGTLTLNGVNTYTGLTAVSGGTLVAANADALGTTGANTTVSNNATLDVRAALDAEPISVTGTGVLGAGALITADNTPNTAFTGTVGGTVTLTGATSIGGHGNGTLNINGTVAAGAHTLTTLGTGVTTFGAASTLTTLTNLVVADGTTNVNSALGTGSSVVTVTDAGNGTKLRFGSVSQTLSSLTIGAGATVIFTSGAASGALTGDDGGGKAAGFGSPASSFGGGVTVPEPTSAMLLLVGALGMLNRRRRQA